MTEKTNTTSAVIWKRSDLPGYETCRIGALESGWSLTGVAVLGYEGQACRLDDAIDCDLRWVTRSAAVTGWVGDRTIEVAATRDAGGFWQLNGKPCEEVTGCIDIDLNFSPSTNLLPIRRLNLAVGAGEGVRAAWLRFPSFALEPLE